METSEDTTPRALKRQCLRREKEAGIATPQNKTSPRAFFPSSLPSPAARSSASHRPSSTAKRPSSNADGALIADRHETTPKTAAPPSKVDFPSTSRHAADAADMAKQQLALMQSLGDTSQRSQSLDALQEATEMALEADSRQAELVNFAHSALNLMKNKNPGRIGTTTGAGAHFASCTPGALVPSHDGILELLRQRRSVSAGSEGCRGSSILLDNEGERSQELSICKEQTFGGVDSLCARGVMQQANWAAPSDGVTHYDNAAKARYIECLRALAVPREASAQLSTNCRNVQGFGPAVQNTNGCQHPSFQQMPLQTHGTPGRNDNSAAPTAFQFSASGGPQRRADPSVTPYAPPPSLPEPLPSCFRFESSRGGPGTSSSEVILQTLQALMSFNTLQTAAAAPCDFSATTAHSEKDPFSPVERLSAMLCTNSAPAVTPDPSAAVAGSPSVPEPLLDFQKQISPPAFGAAMQPAAQHLLYNLLLSCGSAHNRQTSEEREKLSRDPNAARSPGPDTRQHTSLPTPQDVFTSQSYPRPAAQCLTFTPPRVPSPLSGGGTGNYENLSSVKQKCGPSIAAQIIGQALPGGYLKNLESVGRSGPTCNISGLLAKKSHSVELCRSSSEDATQITPTHSTYGSIRRRGPRLTPDKDASPPGLRGATGELTGISRGRRRTESLTRGDSMNRTDSLTRIESTGKSAGRARGRCAAAAADGSLVSNSLSRGVGSTAGGGAGTNCNQEDKAGKPDVTLGGNRPHYHVAKQEWRVRYYLNGKRKMRTYSAKFYGYEAAHSMATDFAEYVDKHEALPHPVCKAVGLGGGRGAAYSSMVAGRALPEAAVIRERDEQSDISAEARYTRDQQLMRQQLPGLLSQDPNAAATAAKGFDALRLARNASGPAATFQPQHTHSAPLAIGATTTAVKAAAAGIDSFSVDGESSPAVTRVSGLSRTSTRGLQTSATPSEEENSPYYEHSLSGKVELDRESSSRGSHSHELHEDPVLQQEYCCMAEQQTGTPSSLSAADFAPELKLAAFFKSRKRRSSAVCCAEGILSAPASLPEISVSGGTGIAKGDKCTKDGSHKSMERDESSYASSAAMVVRHSTTGHPDGLEGLLGARREAEGENKTEAEAFFEGLHEKEKLYLSKLFSSVWLPPACSLQSPKIIASHGSHDSNSSTSNSNRMSSAVASFNNIAAAGPPVQERCAPSQRQEEEGTSLQNSTSSELAPEECGKAPSLSLCSATTYKLSSTTPAVHQKALACSLAALLQTQAGYLPSEGAGSRGKEGIEEEVPKTGENCDSSGCSSIGRSRPSWTDPTDGGKESAWAAAARAPTAEQITMPIEDSRTQPVGALRGESEKIISMTPGHATAAMLAKTALSQQMLDIVTLFDEFIRGFEKEFVAEQLHQQRRALLEPTLCISPKICSPLPAFERRNLQTGDEKHFKDSGPACGLSPSTSCHNTKEYTQKLLTELFSDYPMLKSTNDSTCLPDGGCSLADVVTQENYSSLHASMPLLHPSNRFSVQVGSPRSIGGVAAGLRLQLGSSELLVLSRVLVELTSSTYVLVTTLKATLASSSDTVQKHYESLPATFNHATSKLPRRPSNEAVRHQQTEQAECIIPKKRAHVFLAQPIMENGEYDSPSAVVQHGAKVTLRQHHAATQQQQQDSWAEFLSNAENTTRYSGASRGTVEQICSADSCTKCATTIPDPKEVPGVEASHREKSAEQVFGVPDLQHRICTSEQTSALVSPASEGRGSSTEKGEHADESCGSRQGLFSGTSHAEVLLEKHVLFEGKTSLQTTTDAMKSTAPILSSSAEHEQITVAQSAERINLAESDEARQDTAGNLLCKGSKYVHKTSGTADYDGHQHVGTPHKTGNSISGIQQSPREKKQAELQERVPEITQGVFPEGVPVAEQQEQTAHKSPALAEGTAKVSKSCITPEGVQEEQRQQMAGLQRLQHQDTRGPGSRESAQQQARHLWSTTAEDLPASDERCTCTKSGVVLHNILTLLQSQQRLVSVITQLQMSVPQYLRLIIRVAGHCLLPYKLPPATYSQGGSQTGLKTGGASDTAAPVCASAVGSSTFRGNASTPVSSSASAVERPLQHLGKPFLKARNCYLGNRPNAVLTPSCDLIASGRNALESCRVEENGVQRTQTITKDLTQQQAGETQCPALIEKLSSFSSCSKHSSSLPGFASCGAVTNVSSTELEYNVNDSAASPVGEPERKLLKETLEGRMSSAKTREGSLKCDYSQEGISGGKEWEFVHREFQVASAADSLAHSCADKQQASPATAEDSSVVKQGSVTKPFVTDGHQDTSCGDSGSSTTAASAWGFGFSSEPTRLPSADVPGGRVIADEAALEGFLLRPFQPVACSCQERPCPCDRQHIADLIHMLYTLPKPCDGTTPPSAAAVAPGKTSRPDATAANATEVSVEANMRAAAVPFNAASGDTVHRGAAGPEWEAPYAERMKKSAAPAPTPVKEVSGATVCVSERLQRPQSIPVSRTSANSFPGAREPHPACTSANIHKARSKLHSGIASSRTTSSGSSSSSLEPSATGADALTLVEESLKQMLFADNQTQTGNGPTSYNPALSTVSGSPFCDSQTTGTPHTLLSAAGTPGTASSCATSPFQRGLTATAVPASCLLREASRQSTAQAFAEEKKPIGRDGTTAGERTSMLKGEDYTEELTSSTMSPDALKKPTGHAGPLGSEGWGSYSCVSSVTGLMHRATHLQNSNREGYAERHSLAATHLPHSLFGKNLGILDEKQVSRDNLKGTPDTSDFQRQISEAGTSTDSPTEAAAVRKFLRTSQLRRGGAVADHTALLDQGAHSESTTSAVVGEEKEARLCATAEAGSLQRWEDSYEGSTSVKKSQADTPQSVSVARAEAVLAAVTNPTEGSLEGKAGRATAPEVHTSRENQQLQGGHSIVNDEGRVHDDGETCGSIKADSIFEQTSEIEAAEEPQKAVNAGHPIATCDERTDAQMDILTIDEGRKHHRINHGAATIPALGATTCSEKSCCVDADVRKSRETKQNPTGDLECWAETRHSPEKNSTHHIFYERKGGVSGKAQRVGDLERKADCRGLSADAVVEDREEGRALGGDAPRAETSLKAEQKKHSLFRRRQSTPLEEKRAAYLDSSYPTMLASILPLQSLAHTIARLIVHLHRQLICRFITAHVDVLVDTSKKANFASAVLQRLLQQLTDGEAKGLTGGCSSLWGRDSNASTTSNCSNTGCRSTCSRGSSSEETQSTDSTRGTHEVTCTLPDSACAFIAKVSARLCRSEGVQKGGAVKGALAAAELFARSSASGLSKATASDENRAECLRDRSAAALFDYSNADAPGRSQHLLHGKRAAAANNLFCSSRGSNGVNGAGDPAIEEAASACTKTTAMYNASPFGTMSTEDASTDVKISRLHHYLPPTADAIPATARRISTPDFWNNTKKVTEKLEDRGATCENISHADMLRAAAAAVRVSTEAKPGAEALSFSSTDRYVYGAGPTRLQDSAFATPSQCGTNNCSASVPSCTSDARYKQGFHPLSSADILERVAALTRSFAGCTAEDALEKVSDGKAAEISQFLARAQAFYAARDKSVAATAHSFRTEDTQGV